MILDILEHTPVWVWLIFGAVLLLGLQQTRTRDVSIVRVTVLPVVMIVLSITGVLGAFGHIPLAWVAWAAGAGPSLAFAGQVVAARGASGRLFEPSLRGVLGPFLGTGALASGGPGRGARVIAAIRAKYSAMVPAAPTANDVTGARRWRYRARAVRSVGYGVGVGLCIAFIRPQPLWPTLLYSMCISIACWFFIDSGRYLVSTWVHSAAGRPGWPGWRWMTPIVVVGGCLGMLGGTLLGDAFTGEHTAILSGSEDLRQFFADLLFVLLPALGITYFFHSRSLIADREGAAQAALRQAAESRLRLLEAQLEPHMFFNTLANLHVLIGIDPPRAQAMLDQLIAFLRATLTGSRAAEHPLHAEFSRTRDYLALMQVRMEDRLRTRFDLPESLAQVPVPPLLLQPLVENAIKHGLEPAVQGSKSGR